MNDPLKLYDERVQRMANAIEHRENDRVPIFSLVDSWAFAYAGTKLNDAKHDAELEYQTYSKALSDFPFDAALTAGISNPIQFVEALGGGIYDNADSTETIQVSSSQSELMTAADYDKLIADPMGFILNEIVPKKAAIFQSGTLEEKFKRFAFALSESVRFGENKAKGAERMKQEHGLPVIFAMAPFMPTDLILDYLRDFKGIMMDVKRCPDKVNAASMALVEPSIRYTLGMTPEPRPDRYISLFLHLPQFLRPKEFERVYWPSFKAYVEFFAERGYKLLIYFEKNWEHLYEYISELPKNCILGLFEDDDLRKAKKAVGSTICVAGGMKVNDLIYKKPQECVDIAKGLIDDLAPGGGYVFTTNRVMLTEADGKAENLRAVTEFVADYGKY